MQSDKFQIRIRRIPTKEDACFWKFFSLVVLLLLLYNVIIRCLLFIFQISKPN